jgi:hypothetical protein
MRQFGMTGGILFAAAAVLLVSACGKLPDESPDAGEAPIPIAATHREIVIVTSPMKVDMTFSIVGLRRKGERDDGSTGWKEQFEEQVEAPYDGFVRRRFRLTLANGSDRAREFEFEIDYVSEGTGEVILHRKFRKVFVPPFTKKEVSGYTPIREDRTVHTDVRVREVTEEE